MPLFVVEISSDCIGKLFSFKPVRRPGRDRLKSATDLVFALGAGFENLLAILYAIVDSLVVAGFEVQGVVICIGAPVPSIQCRITDVKYGGRDRAPVALCENDENLLWQGSGYLDKEIEIEIWQGTATEKGHADEFIYGCPGRCIGLVSAQAVKRNTLVGNATSILECLAAFGRAEHPQQVIKG
jgi:hypothetical protein